MSFTKYLMNKFYLSGLFLQTNWYNPLFLDKTGAVIAETRETLEQWSGDPQGFNFQSIVYGFNGSVNIDKVWLRKSNLGYYSRDYLISSFETLKNVQSQLANIYVVYDFQRIGFRVQGVLDIDSSESISKYNSISSNVFDEFSEENDISTEAIASIIKYDDLEVRVAISQVKKEDLSKEGPARGFMFDVDVRKHYDKEPIENFDAQLAYLKDFIFNNYEDILSKAFKVVQVNE